MISIRNSRFIRFNEGAFVIRAELDVDTADELPDYDDFEGHELAQGSIAHVITTGEFYCLAGDNAWYNQDGSDAANYPVTEEEPDDQT
ncbi:MAG: hypothetical protein IJK31_07410 [Ruminococcus sp.]|nr:hypothetical protein [Ruminococcus sp.]HRR77446.1 hypothetical protein [Ruminococcus sp.]